MPPPLTLFPSTTTSLTTHSQLNARSQKRKDFDGDLKKCELFEMLQYECSIKEPVTRESRVQCWPVERLFRRCRDRDGTFTIETTAWEGKGK